ncbi:MAG: SUMF1/EgtB/PvdO family nonheme iron enzyme, partial [Kiritimatiellia bacterium]|nr:SUMF1/EgtB/PvdO family nonheme iron enzyme [Kiritimatiellia bacterium]
MNRLLPILAWLAIADAADSHPLVGKAWTVPDVGMSFVWVESMRGWVGQYEVTNGEFRRFRPEHRSEWLPGTGQSGEYWDHDYFRRYSLNGDDQPVVMISFEDAQSYATWLTSREKQAGRLPVGFEYRLLTTEEWKAAALCGKETRFPWGNAWPPAYGNYADESFREYPLPGLAFIEGYHDGFVATCPVRNSGHNEWMLYGICGNVYEMAVSPDGRIPVVVGDSYTSSAPIDSSPVGMRFILYSPQNKSFLGGFRLGLLKALSLPDLPLTRTDIGKLFEADMSLLTLSPEWTTFFRMFKETDKAIPVLLDIAKNPGLKSSRKQAIQWLCRIRADLRPYHSFWMEVAQEKGNEFEDVLKAIETYAGPEEAAELIKLLDGAEEEALRSGTAMRILDLRTFAGDADITVEKWWFIL